MERRREVEERYADVRDGPGGVATGGGDWKEQANGSTNTTTQKRQRSPEEDDGGERSVSYLIIVSLRSTSD